MNSLQILSTRSNEEYAQSVFEELCLFPEFYARGYSNVKPYCIDIMTFADGEMEASVALTTRGNDVFLFSSSGRSSIEKNPANAKIELYNTIDAIRRGDPKRIILFEPYCSPARSDRAMGRSSVALWIHFKILVGLGVNYILTYQLHSDKSKTIIDPTQCSIEDIPATLQLMEYIAINHIKSLEYFNNHVHDNWLFCSVDAGGEKMARDFAKTFHTGVITSYKYRNYTTANTVESVKILTANPIGGKEIWIVDDMIDTGNSVEALLISLKKKKVKSVNIAVVHPVFSPPALNKLQKLHKKRLFDNILVLDTIQHDKNYKKNYPFIKTVSSHQLSAQIVMRVHEGKSLSPFFEPFDIDSFLRDLPYKNDF